MSLNKTKVVQEMNKQSNGATRARLRSDAVPVKASGSQKLKETEQRLPLLAGVLKVTAISKRSHAALKATLKASHVWEKEKSSSQREGQPSLRACRHLIHHIDGQREQVEHGLQEAQLDITRLYKSLMENEAIRNETVE